MRARPSSLALVYGVIVLLVACTERSPPAPAQPSSLPTIEPAIEPGRADDAAHAKLTTGGIAAEYAAYFDPDQRIRIVEQRMPKPGLILTSEYTFRGARLLRFHGARLAHPTEVDLEFDMQGTLVSKQGVEVNEAEVAAIRNRAQLLRSHALAQRESRMHGR